MGERGPKRKPASLHLLHGNPSKLSTAALLDEALRVPVEIPEMPSFMRYGGQGPAMAMEARAEWDRLTPHLAKLGLITQLDRATVALYCFWWGVGEVARRRMIELGTDGLVDSTPSGYKQMSAWMQVAAKADGECKSHLLQLGMTPSARSRVTASDLQLSLPGASDQPQEGGWGTYKT